MKILVLGLGNELLSDDGVGILATRMLKECYKGNAEIVESSLSGLSLLELFVGYDKAIVIDAVHTKSKPAGTIYEIAPEDIGAVYAPSPHYTGLPELLSLAKQLELEFPREIKIIAMEVADPYTIGGGLTEQVNKSIGELINKINLILDKWEGAACHA
jgi:hydrogenase maturation protease